MRSRGSSFSSPRVRLHQVAAVDHGCDQPTDRSFAISMRPIIWTRSRYLINAASSPSAYPTPQEQHARLESAKRGASRPQANASTEEVTLWDNFIEPKLVELARLLTMVSPPSLAAMACLLRVTGCRRNYVRITTGVPQIADDLLQCPSRQSFCAGRKLSR
jgi:hypothetical protein